MVRPTGQGIHRKPHHASQGLKGSQDNTNATTTSGDYTAHGGWAALADELIAALAALEQAIKVKLQSAAENSRQGSDTEAPEWQQVREHLHQGAARTAVQLAQVAQIATFHAPDRDTAVAWTSVHARPFDHPLIQLAQAYGAAFGAVEMATQLYEPLPKAQVPNAAERLVELALKAAKGLRQAVDLAFGQQGLGTVQLLCDYIATLENQADALYHSAVVIYLARRKGDGQEARWTDADAKHIQRLSALEALTDRCEEVAEALLLAEHLL
jgi:hypothetical protein